MFCHWVHRHSGPIVGTNDPVVDHNLEPDVPYRLWNLATGFLLQRDPNSPENMISCNGSLKDMDYYSKYDSSTTRSFKEGYVVPSYSSDNHALNF